jgi:hypothetical protein
MFFMAFVFVGASMLAAIKCSKAISYTLIALTTFVLIGGPHAVVLSTLKDRLTIGDAGKLNYALDIHKINLRHWQGGSPGNGFPLHPTRQIFVSPDAFEFGNPVGGTYPVWYDPSYWYEGIRTYFAPLGVAKNVLKNGYYYYYELLLGFPGVVIIGAFLLLYMSDRGWSVFRQTIADSWPLLIPALAGMCLFLPLHVEGRFVAPWVTVLLLVPFLGVRSTEKRLVKAVTLIIIMTFIVTVGPISLRNALVGGPQVPQGNSYWEVADSLKKMGLQAGDKIATTSDNPIHTKWARLARVKIVAEAYHPDKPHEFWTTSGSSRNAMLAAFQNAGAKIVVADSIPYWATDTSGWRQVQNTTFYVYFLPAGNRIQSSNVWTSISPSDAK